MTHPKQATQPDQHRLPNTPRHWHLTHHTEADGTVHTLCGLTIPHRHATHPSTNHTLKCPACDIATHLLENL